MGLASATIKDPITPGRDPANIDRRGLVGVGELATPRWTRGSARRSEVDVDEQVDEVDEEEEQLLEDSSVAGEVGEISEQDAPDSPWTIEAVDGEGDDTEVCVFSNCARHVSHSVADLSL